MENTKTILSYLEEKNYQALRAILVDIPPADISILFDDLPAASLPLLFRLLPKEQAAEVFVELSSDMQEDLIEGFSDSELKEVLDELYLDDTVDIIEEMPANVVKRIIRHSTPEVRAGINDILKYPKDSAGSIMTIEYVDLKKDMTVADAFTRIRRTGVDKETIYTCYVTDPNRVLLGLVSVKDLLLADYACKIGDIMEQHVIYVNTLDDQEDVARQFNKYDFLTLPVVDNEKRLVGIITVDDAIDVIQEENNEDFEVMAAITPTDKPYMKTGVLETWKKRIPWLILLMLSATFTSQIINAYEDALSRVLILTTFIPLFMDTAGNAGSQSSVAIIRSISLGEVSFRDIFRILWKELRVAFLCGITLSTANFLRLMIFNHNDVTITVALVVSLTLMTTVFLAKIVGCLLPLLAEKIGFDPAVMASPFITTIVDALSLIIYFNIASMLLHI